tara:strand:+ start:1135 stop:1320 length:186 start_codon:yes stop_codon:yes gene_type:complete
MIKNVQDVKLMTKQNGLKMDINIQHIVENVKNITIKRKAHKYMKKSIKPQITANVGGYTKV